MHGHFNWDRERPSVDKDKSLVWLCSLGLMGEVESLMTAVQDQAFNMRYHWRNIMKQSTDSKCRICCKAKQSPTPGHCNPLVDSRSRRQPSLSWPWSSSFQLPASLQPSSLHPSSWGLAFPLAFCPLACPRWFSYMADYLAFVLCVLPI